jgi:hypothetical protein
MAAILVIASLLYLDLAPDNSAAAESVITASQITIMFFGWVIFSPVIETLFLSVIRKVASNYLSDKPSAVLAASVLAASHGFIWWAWPIIVFIPFLIFSIPFMQHSASTKSAIVSSALTHSFHNLYGFIVFIVLHRMV